MSEEIATMEIVILDYTTTDVILLKIPSNIVDIESYLIANHGFHSSCYWMGSGFLNLIDKR